MLWHLTKAIEIVKPTKTSRLLVLGDVVDRGLYSEECLNLIRTTPYVEMCLGNHELGWRFIAIDELDEFFISQENWDYIYTIPVGFKLGSIYLTHCYQPREILLGQDRVDTNSIYGIFETDYDWVHKWDLDYTIITGHIPTRTHPQFPKKKRLQGEVLRYGDRIMIDGGTPTTGILPIYNVTHDYEITIFNKYQTVDKYSFNGFNF